MTVVPQDLESLISELTSKVDSLSDRFGYEEVGLNGEVTGTGLMGRVIRVEAKVMAYDRLKERAIGAFATASLALAILWWLTKDRLASFFGVGTP